jgi:ATP-dependent Clp endopeptidase proteolytic subunit ClpP
MSKTTLYIVNAQDNEIRLYGYIGVNTAEGENDFETFKNDLQLLAQNGPVTLRINSGGGSMVEGLSMYDFIKNTNQEVIGIVEGMAASMAGVLLQACTKRIMTANSRIMIHRAKMGVMGDADQLEASTVLLKQEEAKIIAIYSETTGKTTEEVSAWLKSGVDKWFGPKEALENGLVDEIMQPAMKVKLPKNIGIEEGVALFNSYLIPANYKKDENYTMKKPIINLFNSLKIEHQLTEESNEEAFASAVKNALAAKDVTIQELENKLATAQQSKVAAAIAAAEKEGKITAENKASWETLLNQNYEAGTTALSAVPARIDVNGIINRLGNKEQNSNEGKDPRAAWDFKMWGSKDPKGLAQMKVAEPDKYEALLSSYLGSAE